MKKEDEKYRAAGVGKNFLDDLLDENVKDSFKEDESLVDHDMI